MRREQWTSTEWDGMAITNQLPPPPLYRMDWLVVVLDGQQPFVQLAFGRQLEEGLGLALLQQVHCPSSSWTRLNLRVKLGLDGWKDG